MWRINNADFNPFNLDLIQVRSHVLYMSLRGLTNKVRQVLNTIAAFRASIEYSTLVAVLVGQDALFRNSTLLDDALRNLENRGLIGWNQGNNHYDIHPVVRGVVWRYLEDDAKHAVYTSIQHHLTSISAHDVRRVDQVDETWPYIELFNTLINLQRYQSAYQLLHDGLAHILFYNFSRAQQVVELCEMLFPAGLEMPAAIPGANARSFIFNTLGLGYDVTGHPSRGAEMYKRSNEIDLRAGKSKDICTGLYNLASAFNATGELHKAEVAAREALLMARRRHDSYQEAAALRYLGLTLSMRGHADEGELALRRAIRIFTGYGQGRPESMTYGYLAQHAIWIGDAELAMTSANKAAKFAQKVPSERDAIRALRLLGLATLEMGHDNEAEELLLDALRRARTIQYVEEEIRIKIGLSEVQRRAGNHDAAKGLLDEVWDPIDDGPYAILRADACLTLAAIECSAGNRLGGVTAATKAYRSAWLDGPPFAYHYGLTDARDILIALRAFEPTDLRPFDVAKHPAVPQVDIEHRKQRR